MTIKQIATQAGVSIGTVDRVLHKRGGVSHATEALVLEICRQNGYEQNIVGKAMAMQRKPQTVAVVINSKERNSFAAQVYAGISAIEAEIRDYQIRFLYRDIQKNTVAEQLEILSELEKESLAGLIIKPVDSPIIQYHLNRFAGRGVPIVLCTSDMDSVDKLCFVGQSHYRDGRVMANTLSKFFCGDLRILMLVGSLQTNARRARIDGFLSYLKENRTNYDICNVCEVSYRREEAFQTVLGVIERYPEANALYINTPEIEPCVDALDSYGRFRGLRFCFGHRKTVGPMICAGKLDFAIGESPFQHGYRSGEALFKYLLTGEIPSPESCVFGGEILLEENSGDISAATRGEFLSACTPGA